MLLAILNCIFHNIGYNDKYKRHCPFYLCASMAGMAAGINQVK